MSDKSLLEHPSLNVSQLGLGISQMLSHLQRIGISHLPMADQTVATHLTASWNVTEPSPTTSVSSEPASRVLGSTQPSPTTRQEPKSVATADTRAMNRQMQPTARNALPVSDRQAALDQLRQQVSQCTLCHELACTRKQTVFGEGNVEARVCFFGEAPGADEDREGVPFVGRAGQLLTKIIAATKLSREEVYILNTLKCRPPGNRNPLPEELSNCRPYFEAQFNIIQPEYIVCLGLYAAQALLHTTDPVGKLRGCFHSYQGSKVIVTYHPSYLLRNEKMKGAVWQDMQMLMRDMGTL